MIYCLVCIPGMRLVLHRETLKKLGVVSKDTLVLNWQSSVSRGRTAMLHVPIDWRGFLGKLNLVKWWLDSSGLLGEGI